MCGIVGIADLRGTARPDPGLVASMAATLAHRGPDGSCVLEVGDNGRPRLTFGYRRLGIVDLGIGARAFTDESGRLRVICNGEIYNHPELRRELEKRGHRFETRCDTEVIPHLYEEHGLDFVSRINGMFALAVFDARDDRLVLARDRAGEKPLYYAERGGGLLFASEIKALLAHPSVSREIDLRALTRYLAYGYFPAPHTPFRDVRKLPAGHVLIAERGSVRVRPYWNLRRFFAANRKPEPDLREAAAEVRRLLMEGVRLRLRADVPVGIFFSGGVDSSCIAALAVEASGRPIPTFTLGFEDEDFDEAGYARRAAARIGTDHHEWIVGEPQLLGALVALGRMMDEPLADASLVPTYLLSRFARRRIRVALGGEGGDELFAGYPTYVGERLARAYGRLPRPARALVRRVADAVPPSFSNVGLEFLLKKFVAAAELAPVVRHQIWFGAFPAASRGILLSDDALRALSDGPEDDALAEARAAARDLAPRDPLDTLLLTDFLMFLQDDLLTKIDRASMATSLEVRAPFLHHPLVEYVARLPASAKLRGLRSKRVLRLALRDRLPRETLSRAKRGFNIPIARFMHGSLGPLLRRALDPARVTRAGILRPAVVSGLLEEHMGRRRDNGRLLWTLLMLQLWHSRHLAGGDLLETPGGSASALI
ncbi:MAG: asparagine synthase (glutamine-hydrolyzing) [Acidobacteriota bacterium]